MELEPVVGEAELHFGLRKQPFLRKSHLGLEGVLLFFVVFGAIAISPFAFSPTIQVTFVNLKLVTENDGIFSNYKLYP